MNKKTAAASLAATVALTGTLFVLSPAAQAAGPCPSGQKAVVSYEQRHNPVSGKTERATITECKPEVTGDGRAGAVSSVKPAVGVDFRDDEGNRTASGLSPRDEFQYMGMKREGKNGDGTLILVKQLTQGKGGWGPVYFAWIPVKYTVDPSLF